MQSAPREAGETGRREVYLEMSSVLGHRHFPCPVRGGAASPPFPPQNLYLKLKTFPRIYLHRDLNHKIKWDVL